MLDPPSNITFTTAVLTGNVSDFMPGHNGSYFYQYGPGPCSSFPNANTSSTPVQYIENATASSTTAPVTITNLTADSGYCASLCVEDTTAGSGYICSTPTSFSTAHGPEVITEPATDVGEC